MASHSRAGGGTGRGLAPGDSSPHQRVPPRRLKRRSGAGRDAGGRAAVQGFGAARAQGIREFFSHGEASKSLAIVPRGHARAQPAGVEYAPMTETVDQRPHAEDQFEQHLSEVQLLLARQRRVEVLVQKQDTPRHELVEDLVHRQHMAELNSLLRRLSVGEIARVLEALPEEDRLAAWQEVEESRCESVLERVSDPVRAELVEARPLPNARNMLSAFELKNGRLAQVRIGSRADLAHVNPIW